MVVEQGDVEGLKNAVRNICDGELFSSLACTNRAGRNSKEKRYAEYIELFAKSGE